MKILNILCGIIPICLIENIINFADRFKFIKIRPSSVTRRYVADKTRHDVTDRSVRMKAVFFVQPPDAVSNLYRRIEMYHGTRQSDGLYCRE
jgi:hypothetical protein